MDLIMVEKNTYRGFTEKKTWSRETTGKTRHRWKDNIKVNLKTAGWNAMDWMHVAVNGTMPLWPW